MYTSLLSIASLCAVVLAGAHLERRQDISAIQASLSQISASLAPPPSIAAQLTGIPSSIQALQTNPAGINQLISEFATGTPSWFAALPSAAQSYVVNGAAARLSAYPVISSLQAQLTAKPVGPTGVSNATTHASSGVKTATVTTGGGNSTVTTKKLTSTATESEKTSTKGSTSVEAKTTAEVKPTSSSSKGAAAHATGAIAVGLAGAAGFVGMVMAL
ncbi:hypothetical protein ACMFMG_008883 [Clarireedia jacksonii]